MVTARTWAVALTGAVGDVIEVEADQSDQQPDFRLIGLPDKALGEAVSRVRNATANCAVPLPRRRLTVNLSPASVPKHGSAFDAAIAVAALATDGTMDRDSVAAAAHVGELGLDGRMRPVAGVLPCAIAAARAGVRRIVVPRGNEAEARLVPSLEVVGATCLGDIVRLHGGEVPPHDVEPVAHPGHAADTEPTPDLAEVIGQPEAVDALVAAAAGGHHLLMSGPPGAGKTMLARRLPGLLPDLDDEAALEATAVRSVAGAEIDRLVRTAPFEAPHHTASIAALVGGGSRVLRPGAIARASRGVLFLDEAGEFSARALDALRQPLESGEITIHRAGASATFPAAFQLVLATNPCPCGLYGVRGAECTCPPMAIRRYLARLSGPLRDRIDIELHLSRVSTAQPDDDVRPPLTSAQARERVAQARDRAAHRLRETPWRLNAHVTGSWLRQGPCALSPVARRPLDVALNRGLLTLRGYDRTLRLAWSIADLAGRQVPTVDDIGRALFLKKGLLA